MTTIHLAKIRSGWQVFGNYDGADDRFTFGVRSFSDRDRAAFYAERLLELHSVTSDIVTS